MCYAKQKHLGSKKVRGQSEATLQTSMCNKKLSVISRSYFTKTIFNSSAGGAGLTITKPYLYVHVDVDTMT